MKRKEFQWKLPAEIQRRLGESSYGRQRAICSAGHILIILHTPPRSNDVSRDALVFLREPNGKLLCNGQEGGEAKLLLLLRDYRSLFQKLDAAYDNAQTASDLFQILEQLAPLNRASTNLHNALQSARENAGDDLFLISQRDEAYEISRNFELLLADAKLALDYRIAENAEAQALQSANIARAQHKLNVLAAVTFPLVTLASILGMNLQHGLEHRPIYLFWFVLSIGAFIGFLTRAWVVR